MSVRPRNIFVVANNIEELGGLQRVVHRLAGGFAARGHRVELIGIDHAVEPHAYGDDPSYRSWVLNETREPSAWKPRRRRDRFDLRARTAERQRRQAHADAVGRLSERFRSVEDGIVIVSQVWAMNWVSEADTSHLRVIGMSHESYDAALNSQRLRRIQRHFVDIDLFLLLTEADASAFERDGFNNVEVMPNPLSFFPDRPSRLERKRIVAAGRYSAEKGYDQLIEAFALACDRMPGWTVEVFGSGALAGDLRAQAAQLRLGNRFMLPGLAADIESELLEGSVFALPSRHEGLPLAMAEAMACGLPSVAFDCAPGVRELVTDGADGIVVPSGDVAGMAEAFVRLAEDEESRRVMGEHARNSVRRFGLDEVMARWEKVFDDVER